MQKLARIIRHLFSTRLRTRALFSRSVLAQIEQACAAAEGQHAGEIRFAIETALPLAALWHDVTPRARALQVFAHLRMWDTHHNNGVLIYVLRADRAVEIVADRGISAKVTSEEWQSVCREVEAHYRAGRYVEGSLAAVSGVARLLAQHFPPGGPPPTSPPHITPHASPPHSNELPNQPILL